MHARVPLKMQGKIQFIYKHFVKRVYINALQMPTKCPERAYKSSIIFYTNINTLKLLEFLKTVKMKNMISSFCLFLKSRWGCTITNFSIAINCMTSV